MNIDLDTMPLKELKELSARVNKAISTFEDRKKKAALSALEEQARSLGFSLTELVASQPVRTRQSAAPKYANPADQSETWSGRGRRPRWVDAALNSGKTLESLLIRR